MVWSDDWKEGKKCLGERLGEHRSTVVGLVELVGRKVGWAAVYWPRRRNFKVQVDAEWFLTKLRANEEISTASFLWEGG